MQRPPSTPFETRSTFGAEEVLEQEGLDPRMVDVPYRSLVSPSRARGRHAG